MDHLTKENDVKNSAETFFSLKSASEADILVIVVVQKTSIWPEFGREKKSMTRIGPVADVQIYDIVKTQRNSTQLNSKATSVGVRHSSHVFHPTQHKLFSHF